MNKGDYVEITTLTLPALLGMVGVVTMAMKHWKTYPLRVCLREDSQLILPCIILPCNENDVRRLDPNIEGDAAKIAVWKLVGNR